MNVALVKPTSDRASGESFAAARSRLPGSGVVSEVREAAFAEFSKRGLPHRRVEEWKYTDLRVMLREVAPLAVNPDEAALNRAAAAVASLDVTDTCKLVLVDGSFAPHLSDVASLEAGVRLHTLREILETADNSTRADLLRTNATSDVMVALNAAMATDGVVLGVDNGVALKRPIHIVHIATQSNAASFTRSLIKIGEGAQVTLVESFVAAPDAKSYQVHDALVSWAGDGANVHHVRLVEDARDASNISTAIVTLGAKTQFNSFSLTSGSALSRYQAFVRFGGEEAVANINGVNLLKDRQHGDTTLVLDHMVPHCDSREVFRAVVDDRAHSVFQGRINVHPDAQKTDAKMMTRALLLSDEAEADNKPELEIFADDVQCGHGATTGALDDSLLFYLRARGLPEKEAQALLIQAFVGEAMESIADEQLRETAVATAARWLATRG
ncbi:MAG: Fe-S cluster assembly protein SufD [Rhizobiales bacterium 62-47]|nr:Fe-S cluster assembly protein SufD [Hyphomicrobiales bacterium]OJY10040.1 MAG: Fe-S cluster assembly protein SufD [Rhizobiales bacterium 62-47]